MNSCKSHLITEKIIKNEEQSTKWRKKKFVFDFVNLFLVVFHFLILFLSSQIYHNSFSTKSTIAKYWFLYIFFSVFNFSSHFFHFFCCILFYCSSGQIPYCFGWMKFCTVWMFSKCWHLFESYRKINAHILRSNEAFVFLIVFFFFLVGFFCVLKENDLQMKFFNSKATFAEYSTLNIVIFVAIIFFLFKLVALLYSSNKLKSNNLKKKIRVRQMILN